MEAVGRLHELRGNAHTIAGLAHAPLHKRRHAELLSDDARDFGLSLELEGRRATGDPEVRDPGEDVRHLLGEAVGEVLLVLGRAHVREGQGAAGSRVRIASRTSPVASPGKGRDPVVIS
jgi:hypothetical protein